MNNERRALLKQAGTLVSQITELTSKVRDLVQEARDGESEAFEALSEGAQQGDRGQAMEEALASLDEALDNLDLIDTEEVAGALMRAADRDLPIVVKTPTTVQGIVDQNKFARLPQWAQDQIAKLVEERDAIAKKASETYPDPTEGEPCFLIEDYGSPHHGKALPFKRISMMGVTVEAAQGRPGFVEVRSSWSGLSIYPSSSNVVYVRENPL